MDFLIIVYALLAIVGILLAYCIYSGLLYFPKVRTVAYPLAPLTVAYKYRKQDYSNCVALYKELYGLVPGERCVGVYYDNPSEVPGDKQRFLVGCVVAEKGSAPNPNLLHTLKNHGYSLFDLPAAKNAVMTSFPFKSYLSIILSNRRVWCALGKYFTERKMWSTPWIEHHGGPDMLYIVPMDNQQAFFVPEALEAGK